MGVGYRYRNLNSCVLFVCYDHKTGRSGGRAHRQSPGPADNSYATNGNENRVATAETSLGKIVTEDMSSLHRSTRPGSERYRRLAGVLVLYVKKRSSACAATRGQADAQTHVIGNCRAWHGQYQFARQRPHRG